MVTISKAFITYMQKHSTKSLFIVFTILCKFCIKRLSYIFSLKSILSHICILSKQPQCRLMTFRHYQLHINFQYYTDLPNLDWFSYLSDFRTVFIMYYSDLLTLTQNCTNHLSPKLNAYTIFCSSQQSRNSLSQSSVNIVNIPHFV